MPTMFELMKETIRNQMVEQYHDGEYEKIFNVVKGWIGSPPFQEESVREMKQTFNGFLKTSILRKSMTILNIRSNSLKRQ